MRSMEGFFDADWYRTRYPDVVAAGHDPLRHFIRHGLAEQRDPNPFFDSDWYTENYPDVSAGGMHPLLHYLQAGAAELRNPHPNFDAAWYAGQHPDAAANPLLYHVTTGRALGFPTEKPIDIQRLPALRTARRHRCRASPSWTSSFRSIAAWRKPRRCIASVLADPPRRSGASSSSMTARRSPNCPPGCSNWPARDRIHLVRNPANLGFVASVNRGMREAGTHDVVLLNSDTRGAAGLAGPADRPGLCRSAHRHRVAVFQQRNDLRLPGQRRRSDRLRTGPGGHRRRSAGR